MTRLSEEQLDNAIAWSARAKGEFVASGIQPLRMTEFDELVRGYRRAAALEDMLREWMEELDVETCEDGKCPICGVSPAETHEDACPVERTRALLAEGDE